jgi:NAD(P)-dependent dehydrogenase (short-subunit alcohol dehydrogenase family)
MRIVITGNSSGIGKMITERLESQGHTVVGLNRTGKLPCDVTDYTQVEDCARYVLDTYSNIDGLITCAGTQGEMGKISKTEPDGWSETIRVNLDGTYNSIRAFYPLMDLARRPKILCFAGGGAANGRPFFSAYASAKAGVVRLVETFSMEETGADINVIAPGAIKTNIINKALQLGPLVIGQEEYNKVTKQNEGGDDPTYMLELVDWLLSEKSDGVSGRFISAKWDDWKNFKSSELSGDIYRLRRTIL